MENINNMTEKEIFDLYSYAILSWQLQKIKEIWVDEFLINDEIWDLEFFKNWDKINLWEFNLNIELEKIRKEIIKLVKLIK